ncbi:MAG: hypothetical protein ACE5IK_13120, partial [Acidobacteriota bacterium]
LVTPLRLFNRAIEFPILWQSLQLNLPTSGINDLLIHHGDVIVATQGRALWVLDAIAPLRHLAGSIHRDGPVLVPPGTAWRLRANQNKDTPLPPEEPRGENPPVGAIIDYILPTETTGSVEIAIRDAAGDTVRTFRSDEEFPPPNAEIYFADIWLGPPARPAGGTGHHRFIWNLRIAPPPTLRSSYSIAAVPGRATPVLPQGAFVLPGHYEVILTAGGRSVSQPLEVEMDPRVTNRPDDLRALFDFQQAVTEALRRSVELSKRTEAIAVNLQALRSEPGPHALEDEVDRALQELTMARGSGDDSVQSIAGALTSLASDLESVDAHPTAPQKDLLAFEIEHLTRAEARLQRSGLSLINPAGGRCARGGPAENLRRRRGGR